jgi:hypothetical protein
MGVLRFLMDSPGKVCERPEADMKGRPDDC